MLIYLFAFIVVYLCLSVLWLVFTESPLPEIQASKPKPDSKDKFFRREVTIKETQYYKLSSFSVLGLITPMYQCETMLLRFKEENIKVTVDRVFNSQTVTVYIDTNGYYVNPDWIIMRKPI